MYIFIYLQTIFKNENWKTKEDNLRIDLMTSHCEITWFIASYKTKWQVTLSRTALNHWEIHLKKKNYLNQVQDNDTYDIPYMADLLSTICHHYDTLLEYLNVYAHNNSIWNWKGVMIELSRKLSTYWVDIRSYNDWSGDVEMSSMISSY